jgi:hypothetical protein
VPNLSQSIGLIFIIPIIAFDGWLFWTTGRRQLRHWLEIKEGRRIAACFAVGIALAIWLTFFIRYRSGSDLRVQGFPIPLVFYHLEGKTWTETVLPSTLPYIGTVANFLTGLAIPFIPYKVAEFLKTVKAELK